MNAPLLKSVACVALLSAAAAGAQAPVEFPQGPNAPYVTPDTPLGSGRFPAVMLAEPTLPTHTLYRPARLDAMGAEKLPLVVWGNGACVNTGNRFRHFLSEIASHGFLAVSIGPIGPVEAETSTSGSSNPVTRGQPAPGSPAAVMAAGGRLPPVTPDSRPAAPYTTPNQFIDAIDWAIAENTRAGSPLAGRIDTANIAVMGQSCGGVQAIDAARDKRVKTLGVWNSGLFAQEDRAWPIAAARVTKKDVAAMHTSAIYVTGEPSEVAFKNADDDFERITGVPVVRAWREKTGHSGTYRETHGGAFGPVAVAWLRWQLKGDELAAQMFKGERCGLCAKPDWHVRKKRID